MTRSQHHLTDAEFKAAHKAGLTLAQVALPNGTSASAVSRRARRLGLKFCNKPGVKPDLERPPKARAMRAQGKTFEEIGAALGCSPSAAWWWCQ